MIWQPYFWVHIQKNLKQGLEKIYLHIYVYNGLNIYSQMNREKQCAEHTQWSI